MNVFDYLEWRGDVPLSTSPFNPVDNLVFAELVYTDFSEIVPNDGTVLPLSEVRDRFFTLHSREEIEERAEHSYTGRAPFLMDSMLNGIRFSDVNLCFYKAETNKDETAQFAAVTFLLPDGNAYVAYRGTDGTVVGWKEDFILSYRSGTKGQQSAVDYLDRVGGLLECPLHVGGHSKGGNLAVYAASLCSDAVRGKIRRVWSNDGPGFREEVRMLPGYRDIQPRCLSIIPETSIIGLLLECDCERQVVKSNASGLAQHDGFSWEIGPKDFVSAKLTRTGTYFEKAVDTWLAQQDEEILRSLVDSVFSLFEATGEDTFHSMTTKKMKTAELMMAALRALPKEKQKELLQATGQIFTSSGSAVKDLFSDREGEEDEEGK